jgi:hypothetical protein
VTLIGNIIAHFAYRPHEPIYERKVAIESADAVFGVRKDAIPGNIGTSLSVNQSTMGTLVKMLPS